MFAANFLRDVNIGWPGRVQDARVLQIYLKEDYGVLIRDRENELWKILCLQLSLATRHIL